MSSALPGKMDPLPGQIPFYIFTPFTLRGAFTLQSRLDFAPCDFWLFLSLFFLEGAAGRMEVYQDAVRHFRAQRYTCFGVPIIVMLFRCG